MGNLELNLEGMMNTKMVALLFFSAVFSLCKFQLEADH